LCSIADKVVGALLIVEHWILARLRDRRFLNLADLNAAISELLEELQTAPPPSRNAIIELPALARMRQSGVLRRTRT
jgi:hypothetical protein